MEPVTFDAPEGVPLPEEGLQEAFSNAKRSLEAYKYLAGGRARASLLVDALLKAFEEEVADYSAEEAEASAILDRVERRIPALEARINRLMQHYTR